MAGGSSSQKRKQSIITLAVLALLAIVYFFVADKNSENKVDKRQKEFRYNEICYSKHARCRMDCRTISETEVKQILEKGKINYRKSNLKEKPCPTYAVEGITDDMQKVRVVVANCDNEAVIVTVIDLENEFECDCE